MESFQKVFDSISSVYEKTSGCGLSADTLTMLDPHFSVLSESLQLTGTEALLFSVILNLNHGNNVVSTSDLIDYFQCTPTRVYALTAELETLCKKGILRRVKPGSDKTPVLSGIGYVVDENYAKGLQGEVQPKQRKRGKKYSSQMEMLSDINKLIIIRSKGKTEFSRMLRIFSRILQKGKRFPLVKLMTGLKLTAADTLFFSYLLWNNLTGEDSANAKVFGDMIFDENSGMVVDFYLSYANHSNSLHSSGMLIEADAPVYEEAEYKFSFKAVKLLKDAGIEIPYENSKKFSLIRSGSIARKSLFLNPEDQANLTLFEKTLAGDNFDSISEEFRKKGLPSGVVALFHGFPGTGKTESVLQMAASCGRDIMKVDISQARSRWFGGSEKIIKAIFAEYREYCALCDRVPVLLFNEADAILSARNTGELSGVQKAENNMQNIILDELESFEGIFIATTNLFKNIDSAFDRRFLFKVCFTKPSLEVRAKIWQNKFAGLNAKESLELAAEYELTGGQIDNVYRKSQIAALLNGSIITEESLKPYCEQEAEARSVARPEKIGFPRK